MVRVGWLACALAATAAHTVSANTQHDHDKLVNGTLEQLEDILSDSKLSRCDRCIESLNFGHKVAKSSPQLVADVLIEFCKRHAHKSDVHKKLCRHKFGRRIVAESETVQGLGDDISNVLALMDTSKGSLDARYTCHYQVEGACPRPAVPNFDLSTWWPPKPDNARQPDPSGETFNVLHISDFHVDLDYTVGAESDCSQSMCCTPHSYNKAAGDNEILLPARTYGGYHCDAPRALLKSAMDSVASVHRDKDFEFAIFTGDMADHDELQYASQEDAIESEKVSYRLMKESVGDLPFYITLGNHDSYPYGQIAQHKSGHENKFAWNTDLAHDMWTDFGWLDNKTAAVAKTHYAAFAVDAGRQPQRHPGLRVISLNANFWYQANYYNYWSMGNDSDPSGMLRFLSDELLECEKAGQRAWVIAHVPTGGTLDEALPPASQVFYQILERFSPHVVAGIFFGHTHRDEFQILYNYNATIKVEENALNIAFLDESVTPFRDHNPGWRYYEVDAHTFQVVDIHHYLSRLNATFGQGANGTGDVEPVWEYAYGARAAYDPDHTWPDSAPLNGSFWHRVVHDKIMKRQAFRDLYERHAHRDAPAGPATGCTDNRCLQDLYCYLTTFSVPQAAACIENKWPDDLFDHLGKFEPTFKVMFGALVVAAVALVAYFVVFRRGSALKREQRQEYQALDTTTDN